MIAIIVAAGSGSRFRSQTPKQFCLLQGRPVVMHSAEAFAKADPSCKIVIVLPAGQEDYWKALCKEYGFTLQHTVVGGGATRWQSVKNGLDTLAGLPGSETVLIHDGARPLVDGPLIKRVAAAAVNTDGVIPAVEVTDSLREMAADGYHSQPVDRSRFRAVQTPQGFALWRLREAYRLPYSPLFTDDASVMAEAGFDNIVLVEGSPLNIKITNPADLAIAQTLLSLPH